jgi:ribonuclease HIII
MMNKLYAGSDESGKGDYFGPLVVATFVCSEEDYPALIEIGVRDSKKTADKKIISIAETIMTQFHRQYQYLVLMPEKYNETYAYFSRKKPGLNEMLAWMHSQTICDLFKKFQFSDVVVDKFAKDELIVSFIKSNKHFSEVGLSIPFKIRNFTNAETETSVAAASIIARYLFIKKMDELSSEFGFSLLKGANQPVKNLRRSIPADILPKLCKMHFKP